MENKQIVNMELLQQTFAHLDELGGGANVPDPEKIEGIYSLLDGQFEKPLIQKKVNMIEAVYRIIPNRNIEKLVDRVKLIFDNQIGEEAKEVLSWVVFGTQDALEAGNEDDLLTKQIRLNHGLAGQATLGDEVEGASGKFGFDRTNPIPINGIDNINNYFDKLKLITGESITYKRLRSEASVGLPFLLDQYEVYNLAHKAIARLYIYAYHGENSGKAPDGFELSAE